VGGSGDSGRPPPALRSAGGPAAMGQTQASASSSSSRNGSSDGQPKQQQWRKVEDICEIVRGSKPLGRGSFGVVWRAKLRNGGGSAAVKELVKRKMSEMDIPTSYIFAEVSFMRECNGNERFVQLIDFVETKGIYFIVLEFCDGGDLEHAAKECEGRLHEIRVVELMKQMIEGLYFLHHRNICHRDIKPQNIMLAGGDACNESAKVKLADFGIAARYQPGELLVEKVGTPAFMAPELHLLPERSKGYDLKVDVWAIGVVMVFLLSLEYPFVDGSGKLLHRQLLDGDVPLWSMGAFSGLFHRVQEAAGMRRKRPSRWAQDLIRQMLNPKREERLSARAALRHTWFEPGTDYEDRGDNVPLLKWSDFEEGIAGLDREVKRVAAATTQAAAGVAKQMASVAVEVDVQRARSPRDLERRDTCFICGMPSSATCHVCPRCNASVCFKCAKRELAKKPRCPHCGDAQRNASALAEFLVAGEVWDQTWGAMMRASDRLSRYVAEVKV